MFSRKIHFLVNLLKYAATTSCFQNINIDDPKERQLATGQIYLIVTIWIILIGFAFFILHRCFFESSPTSSINRNEEASTKTSDGPSSQAKPETSSNLKILKSNKASESVQNFPSKATMDSSVADTFKRISKGNPKTDAKGLNSPKERPLNIESHSSEDVKLKIIDETKANLKGN